MLHPAVFVIASTDIASVLTALGVLITAVGGVFTSIYMTVRQNRKIEANHIETMEAVNGTSGKQEAGTDHS